MSALVIHLGNYEPGHCNRFKTRHKMSQVIKISDSNGKKMGSMPAFKQSQGATKRYIAAFGHRTALFPSTCFLFWHVQFFGLNY